MKWRGEDGQTLLLVFWGLLLLWLLLLWYTPPSEGLWKDVRCKAWVWSEEHEVWYPTDCDTVWRIYPSPSAWFYEFVLEPLGWPRQEF